MATTEEFTFPVISNDACPSSIDSPPLWRLSPAASPDPHHERRGKHNEEEEGHRYRAKPKGSMQRKSCSDVEDREYDDDDEEEQEEQEEEEEKMDVLWEDFNEELCSGKSSSLKGGYNNKSSSSRDMVQLGCGQALKLSSSKASKNNNGAIFSSSSPKHSNNKPGVVVLIKVLKRLFMLHNSHHHHEHHQHHHHHRHKSVTVKNMKW